jgi:PAS domain S-box-containing protein
MYGIIKLHSECAQFWAKVKHNTAAHPRQSGLSVLFFSRSEDMENDDKTREQFVEELSRLRGRVAELEERLHSQEAWEAERNQAVKTLQESEEMFRAIFERAAIGIALADREARTLAVNPALQEILGYTEEELLNISFAGHTHPEDVEADMGLYRKMMAGELDSYQMEKRYIRKDGEVVWVRLIASLVQDAEGNPFLEIGMMEDITDRKKAEEALRESEARYRKLVETSPDAITLSDLEGIVTMCNQQAATLHGYESSEEVVGKSAFEFIAQEDVPRAAEYLRETIEKGMTRNARYTALRKDGSRFLLEVNASLIFDADGKPWALMAVTRDVTDRVRSEEQLKFQANLLEEVRDSITATDLEGRIVYMNRVSQEATGLTLEEALGQSTEIFGEDPERGATQREIVESTLRDGQWRGEVVNYDREGRDTILDTHTWLIHDEEGNPTGMCGISSDITERVRVEEELRRLSAGTNRLRKPHRRAALRIHPPRTDGKTRLFTERRFRRHRRDTAEVYGKRLLVWRSGAETKRRLHVPCAAVSFCGGERGGCC